MYARSREKPTGLIRPRKPLTSSKDCALDMLPSRGDPLWGETGKRARQSREFVQNEGVPNQPPSQTQLWARMLPLAQKVHKGKYRGDVRTPLGMGLAEEKVNLRPDKQPVHKGCWTALGQQAVYPSLHLGRAGIQTCNLSLIFSF